MFKIALESTLSNSRIQYNWVMYSPSGTPICFSNLYDLPNEALHNAELMVKHFNQPVSISDLDASSVEEIVGRPVNNIQVTKPTNRKFQLIKNDT